MKQLTKCLLTFEFPTLDLSTVSKIEFAFSQARDEAPLKVDTYPSGTAMKLTDTTIGVAWTPEETLLFEAGKPFYADTRITLSVSEYQPQTEILKLRMSPTLFEEA